MKLSEILKGIEITSQPDCDPEINGIQYDSRAVRPGDLFCCITGYQTDGHSFAAAAAGNGASALIVERKLDIDIPQIVVASSRRAMAQAAANFYGNPSASMCMVGITGTNGKTTTTYMIKSIAEKAGMKVGLIGTIQNMIGDRVLHTERTTPESVDLQHLLADMKDEGCTLVVMEVSSHSLVLDRTYGIEFDCGIFSNLTQDHLDFHKTWEDYIAAKAMLFAQSRISVINRDDSCFDTMSGAAAGKVVSYSYEKESDIRAYDAEMTAVSTSYSIDAKGKKFRMNVSIPGIFTVYNSLAAFSACYSLGMDPEIIIKGLGALEGVSGRFESLPTHNGSTLILDYSHTPDSLENALKTVRGFARGRVISVFGCGGNRDKTKRPVMAGISVKYADFSVVTTDNPRFEVPAEIIKDIVSGIEEKDSEKYITIEDRREAIRWALKNSADGDVILLAGKGHETYQEIKGVKYDFDEKKVVAEIVSELRGV